MECYIVQVRDEEDHRLLQEMGVQPNETFHCVNCFTAFLTSGQAQQLQSMGVIVVRDEVCGL